MAKKPAKKAPAKKAKNPAAKKAATKKRVNRGGRPPSPNASPKAVAARRRKQLQRSRERGEEPQPEPLATDQQLQEDERMLATQEDPDLSGSALSARIALVDLAGQRALARWRIEKSKREKLHRLRDEGRLVPVESFQSVLEEIAAKVRQACDSGPALLVAEEPDPSVVAAAKPVVDKIVRRIRESVHEIMQDLSIHLESASCDAD